MRKTGDSYLDFRRNLTWFLPAITYAFFNASRYNLTTAHPRIAELFGWTYSDYGIILTAGLAVYGIMVFCLGPFIDVIKGRRAITIGAIGAAIFNFIFGLTYLFIDKAAVLVENKVITPAVLKFGMASSTMISVMTLIWSFNMAFQTFGALSLTKINSSWFAPIELGQLSARVGSTIQLGRTLIYWLCPLILALLPWQYIFWIPSISLLIMAAINYSFIRDTPEEVGYTIEGIEEDKDTRTVLQIIKKVVLSDTMRLIAFMSLCLGVVRNSIDHWFQRYYQVVFDIKTTKLITFLPYKVIASILPICMIIAGITAGLTSDLIFKGRRSPIVVASFTIQLLGLIMLSTFINSPWLSTIAIILILSAVQLGHGLMAGTAPIEFGGRKAASTATGMIDGAQYMAGSLVGYGMGKWLDAHKIANIRGIEFKYWPVAAIPAALIGLILAFKYLRNEKPKNKSTSLI